jgi:hypothetical protein
MVRRWTIARKRDDGSIAWEWNIFDHLATNVRLRTRIRYALSQAGECPLLGVKEYTHSNSIAFSADNRILLLSVRFQDWVLAIDFGDGKGTGDVLWRLGRNGDFPCVIRGGDPCPTFDPWQDALGEPPQNDPWFSHQHTAHFLGADSVLLFDNGNRRCTAVGPTADWTCNSNGIRSRMQLYRLEFDGVTANTKQFGRGMSSLSYSSALGGQLLNGNLAGGLGNIPDGTANATARVLCWGDGTITSFLPVQSYTYAGRRPGRLPSVGTPAIGHRASRPLHGSPP